MGEHYYYGLTIDQDYREAKRYFEEAVLDLDDIAINLLGNIYRDGNDLEVDKEKAFESYKAAANLDNDDAMFNLATAHLLGEGTAKDESMAFFWMEKASHGLYLVEPLLELSLMYRDGIGKESNPEKALEYLELAADAGLAEASFMFAKHLLETSEDKADMKYAVDILVESVAEDYRDAIEFLENM